MIITKKSAGVWKKFVVVILLLSCLTGAFAVSVSANSGSTELELLQTALSHLKEDITELQEDILDMEADAETINAEIDRLAKEIANAEAAAKAYSDSNDEALKTELMGAIASAKAELANAILLAKNELTESIEQKADAKTVDSQIASIKTEIDDLESELIVSKQQIENLQKNYIVACLISGVSLIGCFALAVWIIVEKNKKSKEMHSKH